MRLLRHTCTRSFTDEHALTQMHMQAHAELLMNKLRSDPCIFLSFADHKYRSEKNKSQYYLVTESLDFSLSQSAEDISCEKCSDANLCIIIPVSLVNAFQLQIIQYGPECVASSA